MALSADGGTALIGGSGDGGAGAAWLYAVGTATQQGPKLTASDAIGVANVGASVALSADGSTALVGGNGDNRGVGAAWAFAAKNQTVYWDNPQLGSIGTDTGAPSQVDQSFITGIGQTHRVGVAADSQHLYWTAGGFIARANLDGSDANQQFVPIRKRRPRSPSMGSTSTGRQAARSSAARTSTAAVSSTISSPPWRAPA